MSVMVVHDLYLIYAFYDLLQFRNFYIYIELGPKYKQTIFFKNQPSIYETYAKL